jgi:hypothetical protein
MGGARTVWAWTDGDLVVVWWYSLEGFCVEFDDFLLAVSGDGAPSASGWGL